ncbi:1,4-alpha-glucan branching enzyme GlgB [compost metagenome]
MLPFSHDEVVHGKSSMIYKMPGDEWQKFANLRVLYAYMFTQPGTKLLFMGNEFAQTHEWDFKSSLDWHLLEHAPHLGMQKTVRAINKLYTSEPALYEHSFSPEGFEWINADDARHSIYIYIRKGKKAKDTLIVILNLTPVYRENYRIGLPFKAKWKEIFNTDAKEFFGSGKHNNKLILPEKVACHNRDYSIVLNVPPLAATILKQGK